LQWKNENINSLTCRIHHKLVFDVYQKFLDPLNLENPEVIELGCGSGELTARIIKKYGGQPTLVDSSENALRMASRNFKNHNIKADFIKADLLRFKTGKKFDIVHSEGLIEHFIGKEQTKIINTHKSCVKKEGHIIISVPRPVWYHNLWKNYLKFRKRWFYGDIEIPMNKDELEKILKENGLKIIRYLNYYRYAFALAKI